MNDAATFRFMGLVEGEVRVDYDGWITVSLPSYDPDRDPHFRLVEARLNASQAVIVAAKLREAAQFAEDHRVTHGT